MNQMTYRKVRQELLDKLKITPGALNKRCQKLKRGAPLTTEDATYIIAFRNGIKLDRFLNRDAVAKVRDMHWGMTATIPGVAQKDNKIIVNKIIKRRTVKIGDDEEYADAILPQNKLKEASEMAKVFPKLYVLENSIREFIKICMTNLYGEKWWDTQVSRELRNGVSKKMGKDKKDSWHQRRGSHPIDYLDMIELPRLISKIQRFVVPDIIPTFEWFKQLVEEVYKSRCVVCHMNPLEENSIKSVEVKFNQWQKQMNEKKDVINSIAPVQTS